jgi:hypothetical protein
MDKSMLKFLFEITVGAIVLASMTIAVANMWKWVLT